jgi:allantoate deiminase
VLTATSITAQAEKALARCQTLARFSEDREGILRTFLSPPMRNCHREIAKWLEPLGVSVRLDAAGNLRALYPGAPPASSRFLIGSHLDTVPSAGAYDGVLGVVLAVALLEALEGQHLPFAIEVVGFSEEEGVRFGTPFIGSRALVGRLDEELLRRQDVAGISVRTAIEHFGLNVADIPNAAVADDALGYLEFHIEQGPVLEDLGLPLGIVETIAGQSRLEFTFSGEANHAGTTPMHLRHDALGGAAEWTLAVEREVLAESHLGVPRSLRTLQGAGVATVGAIAAKPGVINAIAGEVQVSLDLRHPSDDLRAQAVNNLTHRAEEIAKKRGLRVKWKTLLDQPAVKMDSLLVDQIALAMRKAGCEPHRMVSGAGHDAMILAERVPAAMIFLRTPGGISHHPSETVHAADIAKAIECGINLLTQLAESSEFYKRTDRA